MNTKWKVSLTVIAGVMFGMGRAQAAATADATITVTPVANVSIALSPSTYAYGNLAVAASSVSATALSLSNDGEVSVTVKKHIETESSPAGWVSSSTAGANQYALFVATSTARPASNTFLSNDHLLIQGDSNKDDLKGASASNVPVIAPTDAVDLWFRLDMPTSVSAQTARSIGVRFTAVGQ